MTSNRAMCEMCRRIENGEPITTEALQQYEAQKLGRGNNTSLLVMAETPVAKEFSIKSLTGEFLKAIGLKNAKKRPDAPVSQAVAKTKRRGRLFDNPQFGSMTQLDEELRRQDEETRR